MSVLMVKLLGPPEFWFDGALLGSIPRKSTALLTWLAAAEGPRTRDTAAELLWTKNGLRNLRQELYVLRRLPGAADWLVSEPTLALRCERDLDALVEGKDPRAVWRGPFGEGLDGVRSEPFQDWLADRRSRLEEKRVRCAVSWARSCLERGEEADAEAVLEPLLLDPAGSEAVWLTAAEARLRMGRRGDAATLFEGARERFDLTSEAWQTLATHLEASPLRALSPVARSLLELAALDPDPLPASVLAHALDEPVWELVPALQHLHDAGLWDEGALSPATRESVLEGLPAQAVAALHERLARGLEAELAPPERIAPHIEGAGRPEAAQTWLALARRTGRISAVEGALRTARTPSERTEALTEAILVSRSAGDLDGAKAYWHELDDHAVRVQEPGAIRQAPLQRVLIEALQRDFDATSVSLSLMAEALGPDEPALSALRGIVSFLTGELDQAIPQLEAGLNAPEVTLRVSAANALGAIASLAGEQQTAHDRHMRALAEARSEGRLSLVVRLLNSLGANALSRQDVGIAVDWLDQAARLAEEIGDDKSLPQIRFNLANAWTAIGAFSLARPLIARLLESASSPLERARAFRCRADLERTLGRADEARGWSARALSAFEEAEDPLQTAVSGFNIALAEGELAGLELAYIAIVALGRSDLTGAAAAELALQHTDLERIEELLDDTPTTPLQRAAHLRAALLGSSVSQQPPPVRGPGLSEAYGSVLHAALHPDQAEKNQADLDRSLRRWTEGLLEGQKEAITARVGRWRSDPTRGF